ncbi:glycosyltransferase [candidate division KSB1 bacterium]|nr:glycosyltransferase [candidate division KSB1 bacterium]
MTRAGLKSRPRIAYLLNGFPLLSQTFIINEVIDLRRLGVDLEVYSFFEPPADKVNADVLPLKDTTVYLLPGLGAWRLVRAHLSLLFRWPWRYVKTLVFAFRNRQPKTGLLRLVFKALARGESSKSERQNLLVHFILAVPLAGQISARSCEFILAHFADAAASFAMLVSRLLDVPFGISVHAYDIFTPQVNWREKFVNAELLVTCTRFNRDFMIEKFPYLNPERIHVVYHGVDVDRFVRQNRRKTHEPILLSVGRLVPKKGFGTLIQACKILRERGFHFRCIIIGEGPERPRLEMRIKLDRLVDVVQLKGSVLPSEILDYYSEASLFALPCIVQEDGNRDGIPNVIAEALAMELPVVSTPISGIPELVEDGTTGLLVEQGDFYGLADAIERLLKSASLRSRLGKAGRKRVESVFMADRLHAQLAGILEQAAITSNRQSLRV